MRDTPAPQDRPRSRGHEGLTDLLWCDETCAGSQTGTTRRASDRLGKAHLWSQLQS